MTKPITLLTAISVSLMFLSGCSETEVEKTPVSPAKTSESPAPPVAATNQQVSDEVSKPKVQADKPKPAGPEDFSHSREFPKVSPAARDAYLELEDPTIYALLVHAHAKWDVIDSTSNTHFSNSKYTELYEHLSNTSSRDAFVRRESTEKLPALFEEASKPYRESRLVSFSIDRPRFKEYDFDRKGFAVDSLDLNPGSEYTRWYSANPWQDYVVINAPEFQFISVQDIDVAKKIEAARDQSLFITVYGHLSKIGKTNIQGHRFEIEPHFIEIGSQANMFYPVFDGSNVLLTVRK